MLITSIKNKCMALLKLLVERTDKLSSRDNILLIINGEHCLKSTAFS